MLQMNQYPPFDALLAFEAVARHKNMTLAADELGLTQSAISHRVRRLETYMETPLLKRLNAGLELTPAGTAVLSGLKEVLEQLTDLRTRCLSITSDQLKIGVGTALADHWLIRRLPEFTSMYPDIPIELITVENEAPERIGDLDLRILWRSLPESKSTSTQQQLFQENVFPVCHPSLLPADFIPGDGTELLNLPLLYKGKPGIHTDEEWSWPFWFKHLNLPGTPEIAMTFSTIGPAITAALQGSGAVIARSILINDALKEGRLVRILPPSFDQLSKKVHIARWPARLSSDERVKQFTKWLNKKSEETQSEEIEIRVK
ncbi:MAG: LysR family transcriptional regulator [Methyloligellaceae bacterium]